VATADAEAADDTDEAVTAVDAEATDEPVAAADTEADETVAAVDAEAEAVGDVDADAAAVEGAGDDEVAGVDAEADGESVEAATPVAVPIQSQGSHDDAEVPGLWQTDAADDFHSRWDAIQLRFVDDPAGVAEEARALAAEAAQALQAQIAQRAAEISQWQAGDDTEELRQLVARFRRFFEVVIPR
jgi:hypothetical protein